MIYFDVTKAGAAAHRSGLVRVSARLRKELGAAAAEVRWPEWNRPVQRDDWLFTPELFSEEERPGITAFLEKRPCRVAALFHDAIPLKLPQVTWPQSVARHPAYMKLLARFDRVWAVSETSRRELVEFWAWQGLEKTPEVGVLTLGADFNSAPRMANRSRTATSSLLCIGIIEPRKNQLFLLEVCESLWNEGLNFDLHVVGRVNPHFGRPIVARMKSLQRKFSGLHFHEAIDDQEVANLYSKARASVFPTIAEGCGLPLLESLWMGVPCVCSDLPALRENTAAGGCSLVTLNDHAQWCSRLRQVLTDDALQGKLAAEAMTRTLPTWGDAARTLLSELD